MRSILVAMTVAWAHVARSKKVLLIIAPRRFVSFGRSVVIGMRSSLIITIGVLLLTVKVTGRCVVHGAVGTPTAGPMSHEMASEYNA